MSIYKTCPHYPGETCDCITARYNALSPENRDYINVFVMRLMTEQRAARL